MKSYPNISSKLSSAEEDRRLSKGYSTRFTQLQVNMVNARLLIIHIPEIFSFNRLVMLSVYNYV